jgi:ArsR family transcriptional regulator, lead/cadmium/zinc/bismuth-responsive transcriptional repressor
MLCENSTDCCSEKPSIESRPLLSLQQSAGLEGLFKVLGNQTRLRMLHAMIRAGEMCVSDLAAELGMNPPAISNQLQRLVDRAMIAPRRNGNNVYYRIVDTCVASLLDRGLCLMEDAQERALLNLQTSPAQTPHSEQAR